MHVTRSDQQLFIASRVCVRVQDSETSNASARHVLPVPFTKHSSGSPHTTDHISTVPRSQQVFTGQQTPSLVTGNTWDLSTGSLASGGQANACLHYGSKTSLGSEFLCWKRCEKAMTSRSGRHWPGRGSIVQHDTAVKPHRPGVSLDPTFCRSRNH